jgi:hypothetical protein
MFCVKEKAVAYLFSLFKTGELITGNKVNVMSEKKAAQ